MIILHKLEARGAEPVVVCVWLVRHRLDLPLLLGTLLLWLKTSDWVSVPPPSGPEHRRRGAVRGHRHRHHHVPGHLCHRGPLRLPQDAPRL